MVAAYYSSNDDADISEDENSGKRQRHISGDDLGDSFSDKVKSKTRAVWIDDLLKDQNLSESQDASSSGESETENEDDEDDDDSGDEEEGSEEDQDVDEKAMPLKDWEQSDDDTVHPNLEDGEEEVSGDDDTSGNEANMENRKKLPESMVVHKDRSLAEKTKTNPEETSNNILELPYTIDAPKTFEELDALLENRSDDQIMEAIRRIRVYNAISIAAENREKMQV